jgi:lysophospholipid acyltransferase (LPLAT)-like uncharacterized protein
VRLAAWYIYFIFHTTRWEKNIAPEAQPLFADTSPVVFCFWHGRLLMMPSFWPRHKGTINVLSSEHRDGVFIAKVCKYFHVNVIYGSSSNHAVTAARGMRRALARGESIAMTPDGPRGPCQSIAMGVLAMARASHAPIIPLAYRTSRGRFLKSWDRFLLPFPFGKGIFVAGAPLYLGDESRNADHQRLSAAMAEVMAIADGAFVPALEHNQHASF